MAITRRYICPDCAHEFSFLHLDAAEPPPAYCPGCGGWMGEDPEPMPSAAFISKAQNKASDLVYRTMERDSAVRAEMAGDPSLKITNLKDNLREGDVAAMTPNNAVTQYAEATQHNFFGNDVAGYVGAAKSGPVRDTGARVLSALQGGKEPSVPSRSAASIKGSFGGGG